MKRLEDAIADGDCIHATIKGGAINNDGSLKVSYAAPSVDGQAEVIVEALANAGVEPDTIGYIETHGTGTFLGDPVEIQALAKAFNTSTQKKNFCAIGSVKTNIGHLDRAAGIASLLKTILALKHKQLPPSLHFEEPNPQIDFVNSPFYVNATLSEWKSNGTPRRAGVSSFGIGGTNAHVVLEEAPSLEASGPSRPWQLLLLSTKTQSALETATANLTHYLKQHSQIHLADVAYTLQVGRRAFDHRRMVICHHLNDAVDVLESPDNQRVLTHSQKPCSRSVVFMFSGQGAQYVDMGQQLYQTEQTFQKVVDHCCELLKPHLKLDLRSVLYPGEAQIHETAQRLTQTSIAQPALFVVEYALAQLWMSWGVRPEAMIGHSIGEYVAACLAGVFSLEDALVLVAIRGRLMQQCSPGAMLSIQLSQQAIYPLLEQETSLAGVNSPSLCVVSGSLEAIGRLEQKLQEINVSCRRLHTSHAFHSQMMEPVIEPFIESLREVSFNPPKIPFVSNVSGTWLTPTQATDPNYWALHLRQAVRFSEGITELLKQPQLILLEVGPGRTLSTFAKQHQSPELAVLTSMRHPKQQLSDVAFLLDTLGRLWLLGVPIDWPGFYAKEKRHRIPLPTYPFERQRYWVEPQTQLNNVRPAQVSLNKKSDIADWFYVPLWKQSIPPARLNQEDLPKQQFCTLVFADQCGLGSKLAARLSRQGQDVVVVRVGSEFTKLSNSLYTLNPQKSNDYNVLFNELLEQEKLPKAIAHLWSISPNSYAESSVESFEEVQKTGFYSLLFLAQALGKQNYADELQITVISNNLQSVTGEENISPEKATILGPIKVIGQEYSNISCRNIDITLPDSGSWQAEKLIDQLLAELSAETDELAIAYRGLNRWVQAFEPIQLDQEKASKLKLRERGVYLIAGGLGDIALALAEHLTQTVQAKIIILDSSSFPEIHLWSEWLETHQQDDPISNRIRKLQSIEDSGGEFLVKGVDVTNLEQMQTVVAQVYQQFDDIHGVIYAAKGVGENVQRVLQETSQNECQWQFQTQVYGLLVLEKVLQRRSFDFCCLVSSLSSVLGGLGYATYSAANLFMDAFAHKQNKASPISWISVNWDRWQFEEGAQQNHASGATITELFITLEEGKVAFQKVLERDNIAQIIVSTGDLQARNEQWLRLKLKQQEHKEYSSLSKNLDRELTQDSSPKYLYSRPNLWNDYVPPRTDIEHILAKIWQQILNIEQVGIHDDFFELGGHSLLAIHLIARVKQQVGQNLQLSHLLQGPTIAKLADFLSQQTSEQHFTPLIAIQPHGSKPSVFFVHPIGGSILSYYKLSRHLGSDQPFYGFQALGLEGECEPHTKIEDMANDYVKALQAIQPEGPYFLGGWSMGGVVAFEMAQQLQRQSFEVAMLTMLDSPAPVVRNQHEEMGRHDDFKLLANFATDMARSVGQSIAGSVEEIRQLTFEEQLNYFLKYAKSSSLVPPDFELQQLLQLFKVFKSNVQALRSYRPKAYPNRITYFQARDRVSANLDSPALTWARISDKPIETINVPGNHYTMIAKPHIEFLAEKLNICMNEACISEKSLYE
ncbi:MAG: alpha/beta fold hydrolase [Cyanobacteria bacterium J06635_15]